MALPEIYCFQCTQVVGDPPRLNRFPDGEVCPACRDRVLEAQPSLLPFRGVPTTARRPAGAEAEETAVEDEARR